MSRSFVDFLWVAYVRDNTVEVAPSVSETMLPSGQLSEVASRLGDGVVKELEDKSAAGLLVYGNVKLSECYFRRSGSSKGDVQRHWGCELRLAQSSFL